MESIKQPYFQNLLGLSSIMSVTEKAAELSQNYSHEDIRDELDMLNRQLEDMKETVLNTSVRAHLLEADLATLYDPRVAEQLRDARQNCDKCSQAVYGEQQQQ